MTSNQAPSDDVTEGSLLLCPPPGSWPGIDVQRIPEHQFRAAGTDKFMWKLIVVYLPIAGGIIWLCTKRKVVRAAARP